MSATFHFNLNPFPVCEPLVLSSLAHADLTSRLLEPAGLSHHRLGPLLTAEHSFLCHQSCPQHCFLLFLLPGMETASRVLVSYRKESYQRNVFKFSKVILQLPKLLKEGSSPTVLLLLCPSLFLLQPSQPHTQPGSPTGPVLYLVAKSSGDALTMTERLLGESGWV